MEMYKILTPDFAFSDNRGALVQLVHGGYKQVNCLISKQGTTRGEHYHKKCVEAFYIVEGSVQVDFRHMDDMCKKQFQRGDFFEIQTGVMHSMYFLEDCIMVQMYNEPVELEDGSKDIFVN